jgi:hypothetical protein
MKSPKNEPSLTSKSITKHIIPPKKKKLIKVNNDKVHPAAA